MYLKYVTPKWKKRIYVHKNDVYKNAMLIILYSLGAVWLCINITLSFSETEPKGQRERDTNLRQQSSKEGNAVTAEGLGAEEVTLAVTEAVSPNLCCFGTLDKDPANLRAGDTPRRQMDTVVSNRDRAGASSGGSEGSIPSWETPNSWPA